MQFDYYKETASLCRESYFDFVRTFWHVISKEKLVLNWHIPYLCDVIQHHMEGVFAGRPNEADLVVNISPGTSKSSIFTVLLLPWAWTRMPGFRFIGASFAEELAHELSVKSRGVVQSPLYRKLFPEIKLRSDLNNKGHWANTLGGDRYAVGTGGSVTGRHAHAIVIDDPLDPRGGRSDAETKAAAEYCTETLPSRKVNKEVAWTALVMQRVSVNDPTDLLLSRPNTRHICLPGEETEYVNPPELRMHYIDGLFDPVRLSRNVLQTMLVELGQYGYAGQILQTPIPAGGGMFQMDKLKEVDFAPLDSEFVKIVRFWDKAASDGKGDFTVGVKMGLHKNGSYWILDIVRGQWASDAREKMIASVAARDGKHVRIGFEQEPGSSGIDSAKESTKRLAGYLVYPQKATGKKEVRADTFSVQVNMGNVYIVKGPYVKDYKNEGAFFPNGKNDDQIDSSSGAFSMLVNHKPRLGVLK